MLQSKWTRIAGCCLAPLVGIFLWNLGVTRWRLARNPPPGRFYSVEDRRMYLHCRGTGSPAVVIESGLSSDSLGWYGVQRELSRVTRVCAYDRSGLGLSEPRPGPRDAEAISRQLHQLLDAAGVARPLVPLGWSAGGLYVREYAREFPDEIAALVLVESSSPRQIEEMPGFRNSYAADKRDLPAQYRWERLRDWSGLERLMGRCRNGPSQELELLPPDELNRLKGLYDAKTCRPEFTGGELGELMDFEASAREAGRLTKLGAAPVLIVSKEVNPNDAESRVWNREQEELKSLSEHSWRVIARGSGHAVHHDRPDLLVDKVTRLIGYLRGGATPGFGGTTTE